MDAQRKVKFENIPARRCSESRPYGNRSIEMGIAHETITRAFIMCIVEFATASEPCLLVSLLDVLGLLVFAD